MIPRRLHWCWFSGDPLPEDARRCMESWRRFLPGFEWVEWNAEKACATGIPWVREAIRQKRWAFAADAVRLYALHEEGGFYLDADVEVLRPFDDLLERTHAFGRENGSDRIEAAAMGCEPGFAPVAAALEFYRNRGFSYSEGDVDRILLPRILAETFARFDGLEILPESAFSPKSFVDGKIRATEETYCVHRFASAWRPESVRKGIRRRQWLFAKFPRPVAAALAAPLSLWTNLATLGARGTLRKLLRRR